MRAVHTYEHHPLCDDNGWDHVGPCVIETDFPADPDDPNVTAADIEAFRQLAALSSPSLPTDRLGGDGDSDSDSNSPPESPS